MDGSNYCKEPLQSALKYYAGMIILIPIALFIGPNKVFSQSNKYQPYFEIGGIKSLKYSNSNSSAAGIYDLFIPTLQSENRLLFTDLRIFDRSGGSFEGNVHFGHRKLYPDSEQIIGVYGAFDRKKSISGNYFNQLASGFEYWRGKLFIGGNAYQPIGKSKKPISVFNTNETSKKINIPTASVETKTAITQNQEKALSGVDAQIGYGITERLTGFIGGYYFSASNAKTIAGPKICFTYDYMKPAGRVFGILDSASLEAGAQYDRKRGAGGYIGVKLKISLSNIKNSNRSGFDRHMRELIRRDQDIVISNTKIPETIKIIHTERNITEREFYDYYQMDKYPSYKTVVDAVDLALSKALKENSQDRSKKEQIESSYNLYANWIAEKIACQTNNNRAFNSLTKEERKQAHRKVALLFHPDKNDTLLGEKIFLLLNKAMDDLNGHDESSNKTEGGYKQEQNYSAPEFNQTTPDESSNKTEGGYKQEQNYSAPEFNQTTPDESSNKTEGGYKQEQNYSAPEFNQTTPDESSNKTEGGYKQEQNYSAPEFNQTIPDESSNKTEGGYNKTSGESSEDTTNTNAFDITNISAIDKGTLKKVWKILDSLNLISIYRSEQYTKSKFLEKPKEYRVDNKMVACSFVSKYALNIYISEKFAELCVTKSYKSSNGTIIPISFNCIKDFGRYENSDIDLRSPLETLRQVLEEIKALGSYHFAINRRTYYDLLLRKVSTKEWAFREWVWKSKNVPTAVLIMNLIKDNSELFYIDRSYIESYEASYDEHLMTRYSVLNWRVEDVKHFANAIYDGNARGQYSFFKEEPFKSTVYNIIDYAPKIAPVAMNIYWYSAKAALAWAIPAFIDITIPKFWDIILFKFFELLPEESRKHYVYWSRRVSDVTFVANSFFLINKFLTSKSSLSSKKAETLAITNVPPTQNPPPDPLYNGFFFNPSAHDDIHLEKEIIETPMAEAMGTSPYTRYSYLEDSAAGILSVENRPYQEVRLPVIVPLVFPYNPDESINDVSSLQFPVAVKLPKIQSTDSIGNTDVKNIFIGYNVNQIERFVVFQTNPWPENVERLFRPHSWLQPTASNAVGGFNQIDKVYVSWAIDGQGFKKFVLVNFCTHTNAKGEGIMFSYAVPEIKPLGPDITHYFYTMCANPKNQCCAITYHVLLNENHKNTINGFDSIEINTMDDLISQIEKEPSLAEGIGVKRLKDFIAGDINPTGLPSST